MDSVRYFGDKEWINTWIDLYSLQMMLRFADNNITVPKCKYKWPFINSFYSREIRTSNLDLSFFWLRLFVGLVFVYSCFFVCFVF